jgi:hypothetical protein
MTPDKKPSDAENFSIKFSWRVNVTPTFCKNKIFCANRSAYKNEYKIIVLVKNFQKKILHRMHCMAWHIIFL